MYVNRPTNWFNCQSYVFISYNHIRIFKTYHFCIWGNWHKSSIPSTIIMSAFWPSRYFRYFISNNHVQITNIIPSHVKIELEAGMYFWNKLNEHINVFLILSSKGGILPILFCNTDVFRPVHLSIQLQNRWLTCVLKLK